MNSNHTRGPWKIIDGSGPRYYREIVADNGLMTIAAAVNGESNAQLIAAAPELLAACQEALQEMRAFRKYWTSPNMGLKRGVARAEELAVAAIAKATGQQIPTPAISENLNQTL